MLAPINPDPVATFRNDSQKAMPRRVPNGTYCASCKNGLKCPYCKVPTGLPCEHLETGFMCAAWKAKDCLPTVFGHAWEAK